MRTSNRCLLAGFGLWVLLGASSFAADFVVDAVDKGVPHDGVTDATDALQSVMDTCADRGGGIVRLPTGDYIFRGHLEIPSNVTLQGVFCAPSAWSQGSGTTMNVFEGRGTEDGPPFILLSENATLEGVTIFYPEQGDETIVAYPWCVAGNGRDNVSVQDCLLVNPYQAIDLASRNSGRHLISRVYGYPLRRGISVDKCYDVGRIDNVHFWPFWEGALSGPVARYVQANGEAFIFGRTDWQYVLNTFCFGYRAGYRFVETPDGTCNGNFLGIGADSANIAVQVDQCSPIGLQIANGEFVAFAGDNPAELVVDAANIGTILFSNCSFWGGASNCARIAGKGFASFQQCNFLEWDAGKKGDACIQTTGGRLTVNACRFEQPKLAIDIKEGTQGAIITSNLFGKAKAVHIAGCVPVEMGDNADTGEDDKSLVSGGSLGAPDDANRPKDSPIPVLGMCAALIGMSRRRAAGC